MQFNSIDFLVFFPMAVLIFFVMPRKMRTLWLLIASCYDCQLLFLYKLESQIRCMD